MLIQTLKEGTNVRLFIHLRAAEELEINDIVDPMP